MTLADRPNLEKLRESKPTNTPIKGAATSPPAKLRATSVAVDRIGDTDHAIANPMTAQTHPEMSE